MILLYQNAFDAKQQIYCYRDKCIVMQTKNMYV